MPKIDLSSVTWYAPTRGRQAKQVGPEIAISKNGRLSISKETFDVAGIEDPTSIQLLPGLIKGRSKVTLVLQVVENGGLAVGAIGKTGKKFSLNTTKFLTDQALQDGYWGSVSGAPDWDADQKVFALSLN